MPTVVAKIHPLSKNQQTWEVKPGTSIARVIVDLMERLPQGCKIITFLNDLKIETEEQLKKRLKKDDVLSLRVTPANKQNFRTAAGLSLGVAALGLSWFLSRSSSTQTTEQATIQNNTMAPPPDPPPPPPPEPIAGIGGVKDTIIPQIAGIANRKNNYGVYPRVYGTHRVYPVIVGDPFVLLEGNDQWLYAVLTFGYGELDISDIKIGKTPIDDIPDVEYEVRYGLPGDSALTIYTNDVDEKAIQENLPHLTNVEKRAGQVAEKLSVDIILPGGLYTTVNGERAATSYQVRVEYRLVGDTGAWTQAGFISFSDNTSQPLRKNLTWSVTEGLYDVRLYNQTTPGDGVNTVNASQWLVLRSLKYQAPVRPIKDVNGNTVGMSYLAIKVKASELTSGTLDELNAICKSKLRYYNGSWQSPAITNNPAWIFADMVTGTAFGSQVSTDYIDAAALQAWATFCTDKGLTFNFVYDSAVTVQEALRQVAAAGRASVSTADGRVSVVVDKERSTLVQVFSAANTSNISVRRLYPELPHAIRVRFVNPDGDWQQDERIVYADGYNEDNATRYETLEAIGCTDPNMAWKIGRYQLAVAQLRPKTVSLDVDCQHLVCNRGDLVRLNHDVSMHGLGSGIITAVGTDGSSNQVTLTLDNQVTCDPLKTYYVRVRMADGTFTLQRLLPASGNLTTLTYNTPIAAATTPKPAVGDVVVFGETNLDSKEMLVDSIEHNFETLTAQLTLVEYASGIFSADTGAIPEYTSEITTDHPAHITITAPIIFSLVSSEAVLTRGGNGAYISRIQVSLLPPASNEDVRFIQYQYKLHSATEWSARLVVPAEAPYLFYVNDVTDGAIYDIRCRFVTLTGRHSEWTYSEPHTVIGKTTKPPDVPVVTINADTVAWRYDSGVGVTVPLDYAFIRAKVNLGPSANWAQGTLIGDFVSTQFSRQVLPPGPCTVMLKAVDVAGNESENAAVLRVDFGDYEESNSQYQINEHTTWTGTKTGCSVAAGELKTNSLGTAFWGSDDSAAFWSGSNGESFWGLDAYDEGTYEWSYTPPYSLNKPFTLALLWTVLAENFKVEYRTGGASLFWSGVDSDDFWSGSDTELFWGADDAYQLYPQTGIDGSWQKHYFKMTLFQSNVMQAVVSALSVLVDVPDLIEYLNDVVISNTGTRLTLSETFTVINNVLVSLERDNATYPDAFTAGAVDKLATGPLIKVYDVNGAQVAGRVDVTVKGYK